MRTAILVTGFLFALGISSPAARAASGEPALLKAIAGDYHVLQYNDDHSPTGILQVRADNLFGIVLSPLTYPDGKSPPSNVPSTTMVSPEGVTTVTKEGMLIKQTAQVGDRKIEIRYENYGDFMIIQATDCGEGCAANKIVVGKVGSFGSAMSAVDFLKEVEGTYNNKTVGGIPAKESTRELVASPDFDSGKGIIIAPFCNKEETFCDGGMLVIAHDKMKVWHRNLGGNHHIYDLFIQDGGGFGMAPAGYYRWEEIPTAKGVEVHFKNVQYLLPNGGGKVCLEHIAQPAE